MQYIFLVWMLVLEQDKITIKYTLGQLVTSEYGLDSK